VLFVPAIIISAPPRLGRCTAHLSCAAGVGVHVGDKATLDLDGHALAATANSAIACDGKKCRILSSTFAPGDVSGAAAVDCILMSIPRGKMVLDNVNVHDCGTCVETNPLSAHGYGANVVATAVSVDGCAGGPGINARKVTATGVTITTPRTSPSGPKWSCGETGST
jgi:hypothetical protein